MAAWVTVRACGWPPGPTASVAVPTGSRGSMRQPEACQPMMAPLLAEALAAGRTRPAEPSAQIETDGLRAPAPASPVSASGGDSCQCAPPSADHAASTDVLAPAGAARIAVVLVPVVARPRTSTAACASEAGSAGPASRQAPAEYAKMPATPGLPQLAATSGEPVGVQAAAVNGPMPQARPAAEAPSDRCVVSLVQAAPRFALVATVPLSVNAISRPP